MPQGSRPGERRGGRKKGTPNKKTVWRNLITNEFANDPDLEPVDLFLGLMRSPQLPLSTRIEMARQALPYIHTKPARSPAPHLKDAASPPRVKLRLKFNPEDDVALDDEWLGLEGDADRQPLDVESLVAVAANEAATIARAKVSPMTFLRTVMHHPKTPLNQRLTAASILAPYTHTKPTAVPPSETSFEVEDQYGFTVDPALAKRLRNLARQCDLPDPTQPRPARSTTSLVSRIGENAVVGDMPRHERKREAESRTEFLEAAKALRYVETYRREDADQDLSRLYELGQIRKARELTPQEDAEKTHLTARAFSYQNSAEYVALQALEDERAALLTRRDELYKKWKDYKISASEQIEFDDLRATLNQVDPDPVEEDFRHQVCTEATFRGQPAPSPEEISKRLAEMESSADIIRRSFPPPAQAPDRPEDVDLKAWLRGEVSYQPWQLRKAAPKYRHESMMFLMIRLVRNEKLVPDLELPQYLSWLLYLYDEALKRGYDPAKTFKVAKPRANETELLRSLRPTGPFPLGT